MALPEDLRRRLEDLPDTALETIMQWIDEHFPVSTDTYDAARQRARELMHQGMPIDWDRDKPSRDALHERH